jgi:hypothetical protein
MDPDPAPDTGLCVSDLQGVSEKYFLSSFLLTTVLFEGAFASFFKDKKSSRSHKTVEMKVFSYNFCLMMEGCGSVPLTVRSGSERPKNLRIQIRHTVLFKPKSTISRSTFFI